MADGEIGQRLDILPAQRRAGRVIREVDDQDTGLRGHLPLQLLHRQTELILAEGVDRHGNTVRETDQRRVSDETGFMVKHLIARPDNRPQRQIERLAHADRNQNLVTPIVDAAERPFRVGRERLPEFRHTQIRGIAGETLLQGDDGPFADVPRRLKVGLSDAQ